MSDQEYLPQEAQGGYEEYPDTGQQQTGYEGYVDQGPPMDSGGYSDTIIEVSEQVFSEKIKKIQNQINDLTEFKTLAETKIIHTENSLKRIESILDKLQIAILEKIGSYGKNLDNIKKEMSMMQDSFGKVVNQALRTPHPHTPTFQTHHSTTPHKAISTTKRKTHRKK